MLLFDVNGQTLTRKDHFNPATDSQEYLKVQFTFKSTDWDGKTKTALFRLGNTVYKSMLNTNGICSVPNEVLVGYTGRYAQINGYSIYISLLGEYSTTRITTNEICVKVSVSGFGDAETPAPPTESEYQQMISITTDAIADAEEACEACEAARADLIGVKNLFANAIKGNLSGAMVVADDVSPVEHEPIVFVHGKNMIPFPYEETTTIKYGVTFTVNSDGTITLNGTATQSTGFALFKGSMPLHGKYTISGVNNTGETTHYIQPYIDDKYKDSVINGGHTYTFDGNLTQLSLYVYSGKTYNNVVVKPQMEIGETATEYTQYFSPSTIKVTQCARNIIPFPYNVQNSTVNGVTVTVNSGGSIKISGTATAVVVFSLFAGSIPLSGKYVLSGISGGSTTTYYMQPYVDDVAQATASKSNVVYNATGNLTKINFYVLKGVSINTTIWPQLEAGETATEFEVRKSTEHIPNESGIVDGVASLSPNMTILTDTAGAIVECEYIKDSNKVIEKLTNAIIALGGTF